MRLKESLSQVYVYKDFSDTENHFTQKAKIYGGSYGKVWDMDENSGDEPYSGSSCIRCQVDADGTFWGGWMFLNGYLPKGGTTPGLNDGSVDGQGMDLTGAVKLSFMARGQRGGEAVEFFTCGFGYNEWGEATVEYPDSARKVGEGFIILSDQWEEYDLYVSGRDMSDIACGFGFVCSGNQSSGEQVFYLDDICFEMEPNAAREAEPLLRSYDTDNIYIKNAAFSYDNALTAMAFISEDMQEQAAELLDAFAYAVENDRYMPGRVRNAYAAGDISAFPGWGGGARLPGWYDAQAGAYYEDRYQVGSNVGNTDMWLWPCCNTMRPTAAPDI